MSKQTAVFGGGCFWCTEAVFKMMRGVISVLPGYSGGKIPYPTYEQICNGNTEHVEVVQIAYDPSKVQYTDLLTVFFGSHDPTTLNKQGNDEGTQYRSVIFYTSLEQKKEAEGFIADMNSSNTMGAPVVTAIEPLGVFYEAEDYHKDYFAKNPKNSYCAFVINPKLEKVQHQFASLLENIKSKK